jgi:hypothetical protein
MGRSQATAYRQAEEIEFGNTPAPAEGLDGLLVDDDANGRGD